MKNGTLCSGVVFGTATRLLFGGNLLQWDRQRIFGPSMTRIVITVLVLSSNIWRYGIWRFGCRLRLSGNVRHRDLISYGVLTWERPRGN